MYEIKTELKDWEIAREMFGRNGKKECELIKKMRKHYQTEYHSTGWYIIYNTNDTEDKIGWLIPQECLTRYV